MKKMAENNTLDIPSFHLGAIETKLLYNSTFSIIRGNSIKTPPLFLSIYI